MKCEKLSNAIKYLYAEIIDDRHFDIFLYHLEINEASNEYYRINVLIRCHFDAYVTCHQAIRKEI